MYRIAIVLIVALALLGGCSPKQPIQEDPWTEPVATSYESSADTLTYDFLTESTPDPAVSTQAEPDLPVLEEEVPVVTAPVAAAAGAQPPSAPDPANPRFWIQIFASSNQQSAEAVAQEAQGKLDEPVRVLFLEPYYKVLVGGFTQREEAVELRRVVVGLGYRDAWIFEY